MILMFFLVSCAPHLAARTEREDVRLAVTAGVSLDVLEKTAESINSSGGKRVTVEKIAGSGFTDEVWSELLSGSDRWDAVLVDSDWVEELYNAGAILRIANRGSRSSQYLVIDEEEVGIIYRADVRVIIAGQGLSDKKWNRMRSGHSSLGSSWVQLLTADGLRFGCAGCAFGDLLLSSWDEEVRDDDNFLEAWSNLACGPGRLIDPRSVTWSPSGVLSALRSGDVDIAVLWLSEFLTACEEGRGDACRDGFRISILSGPQDMRLWAWIVPVNSKFPDDAVSFLNHMSSLRGWYSEFQTNGIWANAFNLPLEKSFFLSDRYSSSQVDFASNLMYGCLQGDIDSVAFKIGLKRLIEEGVN